MANEDGLQWGWKRVHVTEQGVDAPESAPTPSITGTFIGAGAQFEGTLQLRGNFVIDSDFRGTLRTDGKITIGAAGSVVGDVWAREVDIFGAVVGDVRARRALTLRAGSRLHGDIETACLEVERHAVFRGMTTMTEPQSRATATELPRSSHANAVPAEPAS